MRYLITLSALLACACSASAQNDPAAACRDEIYGGAGYAICTFDRTQDDIRLFLNNNQGDKLSSFNAVKDVLAPDETLVFAMNGGMYHADRSPVGGYIEQGKFVSKLNTNEGPGNFHMLPNGVFYIKEVEDEGTWKDAFIMSTQSYEEGAHFVRDMTQSGPMLVINGELHPKFNASSESRRIRNGVGQCKDGKISFAVSDAPVNFHSFASLFKDHLNCDSALYLDGVISRLYAPELGRHDQGAPMGPIIGVVAKTTVSKTP